MAAYRLGSWASGAVAAIGLAYVAALVAGFMQVGFGAPIGDPVLAIMEVLTLFSALAVVIAMAAVHQHAAPERRIFGVLALSFTVIFAGITSTVHFVELFAGGEAERRVRWSLALGGVLALAGTAGPLVGDMRLQRIGIFGYAVVMPVAFFLLARYFRAQRSEAARAAAPSTAAA